MKLPRRKLGKIRWCRWTAGVLGLSLLGSQAVTSEVDIRRDATVAAIERVMPSVVNIRTSKLVQRNTPEEEFRRRFFGWRSNAPTEEVINNIGSGVIIDATEDEGYILTNFHVLQQAQRVQVQLWDGREYEAEPLLKTSLKDLALLKIVRKPGDKPFIPVTMAQDDDLLLGETVIAMGNPFGLGSAVTRGILSSKNRRSTPGNTVLNFQDWLQTDADINPGNSGGPLLNIRGELIGINVAVYEPEEEKGKGTGFAIPVKQISNALSDFFTLEWTAKLWLGARFRGSPHPLTVREVQPGSPADRAGLRVGQDVLEVNGKAVRSLAGFNQLVASNANRKAAITVSENGTRRLLNVELVTMADLTRQMLLKRLGLTVQPLSDAQAANYQMKSGDGLVVGEVEPNSPAATAQLQAGMVLTVVDGFGVGDLVNVAMTLGNKKTGERVPLTVLVVNRYPNGPAQLLSGQVSVVAR